jgi:hypothetical protein
MNNGGERRKEVEGSRGRIREGKRDGRKRRGGRRREKKGEEGKGKEERREGHF